LLGIYADEYRRVSGAWRISRTRLVVVWPQQGAQREHRHPSIMPSRRSSGYWRSAPATARPVYYYSQPILPLMRCSFGAPACGL